MAPRALTDIGDVPPAMSNAWSTGPGRRSRTRSPRGSRASFLDAGAHTIGVDVPATVPELGGVGTIASTARYGLTFKRVNEDGSPYTG